MYDIRYYTTGLGRDLFISWLESLRDPTAKKAIVRRLLRLENGHFGDHKFCRDGVWELRIDVGPGYRAYYAIAGQRIVLLLCGGNKRSQSEDIDRACEYWQDWQRRSDDER